MTEPIFGFLIGAVFAFWACASSWHADEENKQKNCLQQHAVEINHQMFDCQPIPPKGESHG